MTYAEWLVNTMYDMAQQCATHYREQSRTHNLRYPSTVAFAIDVTQPTRTGYGVGGWGWGWPCQIGGHDIKRGGHYDTPADAFAQLAPELGTTLQQTVGVRWDALNCAEVRAVNDLLTDHPEAALQSLYVACFWLSNGAPAQPCHSCTLDRPRLSLLGATLTWRDRPRSVPFRDDARLERLARCMALGRSGR